MSNSNPMNWTGLLNWSTKYTDGTNDNKSTPINKEKYEFLKNAIQNCELLCDPFKVGKEALSQLEEVKLRIIEKNGPIMNHQHTDKNVTEVYMNSLDIKEVIDALQEIDDIIDNPGISQDLSKIGGLKTLAWYATQMVYGISCIDDISHSQISVPITACHILSLMISNDQTLSPYILEIGLPDIVILCIVVCISTIKNMTDKSLINDISESKKIETLFSALGNYLSVLSSCLSSIESSDVSTINQFNDIQGMILPSDSVNCDSTKVEEILNFIYIFDFNSHFNFDKPGMILLVTECLSECYKCLKRIPCDLEEELGNTEYGKILRKVSEKSIMIANRCIRILMKSEASLQMTEDLRVPSINENEDVVALRKVGIKLEQLSIYLSFGIIPLNIPDNI